MVAVLGLALDFAVGFVIYFLPAALVAFVVARLKSRPGGTYLRYAVWFGLILGGLGALGSLIR